MSYSRFFMPLLSEATGYDFKGKTPAGRCIVESRNNAGKLSLWAQDLKPETKYSIYIIFAEGGQFVGFPMGQLNVDGKGKAEFRRDISPGDVHNFMLKEVVSVAVIATNAMGTISPLCGYRDMQVPWRHAFRIWKKEKHEPAREELQPKSDKMDDVPAEETHEELPYEIVDDELPKTPCDSNDDSHPQSDECQFASQVCDSEGEPEAHPISPPWATRPPAPVQEEPEEPVAEYPVPPTATASPFSPPRATRPSAAAPPETPQL